MALLESGPAAAAAAAGSAPPPPSQADDAPSTSGRGSDVGAEVSAAAEAEARALRRRRRRHANKDSNSPNRRRPRPLTAPTPTPPRPSLFARHASWVRANAGAVAALESALSSATWLVPDRFADGEAPALEGAHALLGLLSLYHEALLSVSEEDSGSWSSPIGLFRALGWPLGLAAIQQVEVLVEIAATHAEGSGKVSSRYTPLAWLEGIKAAARLLLLARGGGRLLLDGGASLPLGGGGTGTGQNGGPRSSSSSSSLSASSRRAARTAAVFAALAEFRERRGLPPVPQYLRAAAALKGVGGGGVGKGPSSPSSAPARAPAPAAAPGAAAPASRWWWDSPLPLHRPAPPPPPPPRRSEIEPADDDGGDREDAAEEEEQRARRGRDGPSDGGDSATTTTAMSLLHSADAAADAAAWRGAHAMALGEVLFISRPLIYVLALRRYSTKKSSSGGVLSNSSPSWKPWLISLAVDALSAALLRAGSARCRAAAGEASARLAAAGAPAAARAAAASAEALDWSRDERAELARRRALLALYLVREPAFASGVGPVLDGGERVLGRVPLLGLLASRGADIVRGVTGYYTYTSGS